jgi:hypothetical protein
MRMQDLISTVMSRDTSSRGEGQISRDRETVREWADEHDAVPVQERQAGEPTGQFRMVSADRISNSQERLEWNEFFDQLDDGDYAVIYHGEGVEDPFEVAGHDDITARVDDEDIRDRLIEGETVTSQITETTVVETVVVEEIDVESELVDTAIVDHHVVDVELLSRECTNYDFIKDRTFEAREQFDADSYLSAFEHGTDTSERTESSAINIGGLPYHLEIDVEETWTVIRELVEEFTVESRITGTDMSEADTVENHEIDMQGLHRSIVESGLIRDDRSAEDILAQSDIRSQLTAADRVETTFTREQTVEDEVVDRKRFRTEVTEGELLDMETIRSQEVLTQDEPAGTGVATDEQMAGAVDLTDDAVGKTVVNATGEKMGMVTAVEADENRMYVDARPGLAERISSALGWGGPNEEDYPLGAEQIRRITDDTVELRSEEHLSKSDRER